MFESITENLQNVFRKLSGKGRLSEKNIQDGLREVRMALLQADVNFKVVKDFIDRVTQKAVGQEVLKSINPTQQIIKIVSDELTLLMGPVDNTFNFAPNSPTVLMLVGLQGSGKTTTCAKLAKYLGKKNRKPILVAADVQRPAAIEQLKHLGKQNNIPVYAEQGGKPVKICERSVAYAEQNACDTIILDTAGRLHINQELMDELKEIRTKVKPHYTFLVSDAMTGQDAVNSAKEFNQQLNIDGVILTKLDGDARGGAALSIKAVTGKPIRFVGIGEKVDNLEEFYPDRMASRILGMGDVVSLVEKAQTAIDLESAQKLQEKLKKGDLNLQDFYDQLQQVKKMGPLGDLLKMIPGLGGKVGDVDEKDMKRTEAIIQSMTRQERENPEILNGSRRARIAKGSGTSVAEINSLIKQFEQARKMMREMKKGKGGLWKMMGKFN